MLQSFKKRNTWDLIWVLFRTDFKLKYNDSVLGFIWVLIKPFAIFLIMYTFVSAVFAARGIGDVYRGEFPLYLLMGNIFIQFWNEGTNGGMTSILAKSSLITKVNFPRYIVLISSTFLALINFFINTVIFFVILLLTTDVGVSLRFTTWFVICSGIMYLLINVVSMFLSVLLVRFRDLLQIWELFSQLLFWSTPIFYHPSMFISRGEFFDTFFHWINPISVLLISSRNSVIYKDIEYYTSVAMWIGIICTIGIAGYFYYRNTIKKVAEFI